MLGSMQPCLMANETSFRHAQENSTFCHSPSSIHAAALNKQNILISGSKNIKEIMDQGGDRKDQIRMQAEEGTWRSFFINTENFALCNFII